MALTPLLIAQLVVQYGIPFTDYLIQLAEKKQNVGAAEWASLKSLLPSPEDVIAAVAEKLGLAPNDPKVLAVAELITPRI